VLDPLSPDIRRKIERPYIKITLIVSSPPATYELSLRTHLKLLTLQHDRYCTPQNLRMI
jgi:hypothetical protein